MYLAHSNHEIKQDNAVVYGVKLSDGLTMLERLSMYLTQDEQSALSRFQSSIDRACYIITRANLRLRLSQYLGLPPCEIKFQKTAQGKPYIAGNPIYFNVSHTKAWIVIAFARTPLGIDIESQQSQLNELCIAKRFFHPDECRALMQLPKSKQLAGFIKAWVSKEAWVKANGQGIANQFKRFIVDVDPEHAPRILEGSCLEQWRCFLIEVDLDSYCVLVADHAVCDVIYDSKLYYLS